jgi:predicted DNA-binding transcriptional regulator AlpA
LAALCFFAARGHPPSEVHMAAIESIVERVDNRAVDPDLVDRAAAADALGVSVRTLDRWHKLGFGPPRIRYSRKVRYRASAIRAWIDRHEVAGDGQC